MFNIRRQEGQRQRLPMWNMLVAIVALVGMLGFFSIHAGQAHAAPPTQSPAPQSPAFPSVNQLGGGAAAYHPTPAEVAYAADKSQLADEYVHRVLTGQETLATFEAHYRAFMIKWHLGDVADLHAALTRGTARLETGLSTKPLCPSVAGGPNVLCPVWAAQFPEESWNWCGPATLSTTLVEDSFTHPGTNQTNANGGYTLTRDEYVVSQQNQDAVNDEHWLGEGVYVNGSWNGVIEPDPNNSNWLYDDGTDPGRMTTWVNNFVGGKGGWYAQEWLSGPIGGQIADFQTKVSEDIGTGWDVPTGIYIGAGSFNSMPGYPYTHGVIDHYVPVTYISSDGNTTYYSDPIYGAPAYPPSQGWTLSPPYESTSTSNIVWWAQLIIW